MRTRRHMRRNTVLGWLAALIAVSVATLGCSSPARANDLVFTLEAASTDNLGEPHDIVLSPDGTRLYVADNANDRIVVLHPNSLEQLGVFAEGEVDAPHDVVFDDQGRLLVADTGNHRIAIYAVEASGGRLTGALQGPMRAPEGVGVHPDGRVFATGARSGNLVVFDDGKVVAEVGGFSSPHDVEFDPSGRAWVADAANDRMVRLDDALKFDRLLAGKPYAFSGPRYMDFDATGRLYIADKYSNQIKVVALDGTLLQVLGTEQSGKGEGVFDRPEGVEIRGSDVWFSDTYNDRIVRYRITSP